MSTSVESLNQPPAVFEPNNHSVWRIEYHPVEKQTEQQLRTLWDSHFQNHLDSITSIEQVSEAEINSNNFKILGQKNGQSRMLLLRRVPRSRPRAEIERSCDIMQQLEAQGVPVPHVESEDTSDPIVDADDGYYVLFTFIESNHYQGTWDELVDTAKNIGALDRELRELTPRYASDNSLRFSESYVEARSFSPGIWEDLFTKAARLSEKEGKDSFGKQLLARREEIMRAVSDAGTSPEASMQLVHFDLHPHNLLADGKRLLAILDFDAVRYVEKMRAVSFALHRMVRQYIVLNRPSNIAEEVTKAKDAFIAAYRSRNELSDSEIAMIPYFIKHESLSRLTSAMKEYANTGQLVWKQDLTKQLSNIAEAGYFS